MHTLPILLAMLPVLAAAVEIPAGGEELLTGAWPTVARVGRGEKRLAREEVAATLPDGREVPALRLTTTERSRRSWDIVLHVPTRGAVRKQDAVLLSCWLRCARSEDESGDGTALLMLERNRDPHKKVAGAKISAGTTWRHCVVANVSTLDLPEGEHQVAIHLGFFPQVLELADLQVLNYRDRVPLEDLPFMETTYAGREPDAPWRAEAAARIEEHRRAPLTVKVVDAAGNPVPGAAVTVAQTRHAFGFGCVINPGGWALEGPDGERYRQLFAEHFNKAPTEGGLRWQNWLGTPEQVAERKERLGKLLDWLEEKRIETRGHYLMWAPVEARNKPPELVGKPDELLAALFSHAEMKATWAGERIAEWDAINHIVGWGTRFADVCGGNKVYAEMITKGRAWAPHAEMWINEGQILVADGGRLQDYKDVIDELVKLAAKPDGIGFMAHFRGSNLPDPAEVYRRIEAFAGYGVPLQLTEFDVECGPDEQLQADYLRDAMIVAFSHPSVEAIVMWGFWEGRHWRPSAALWRRDWSIKPAGEAWLELVKQRWWTRAEGAADAAGAFALRGFLGDYALTATHDGRRAEGAATLGKDGATLTLTLEAAE